jgi:hypothetical protein
VEYVLLAKLPIIDFKLNAPGYEYGTYRAVGDPKSSQYFDPDGPDMTDQLMKMHFRPYKPLSVKEKKDVAMALRSLRSLTPNDTELLHTFASRLRVLNN